MIAGSSRGEVDSMRRTFSLEYWIHEGWYVGRLKEVPGVFSQGETLDELEDYIRDADLAMTADEGEPAHEGGQIKKVELEV
jgi:predicted RNase H-like HicB family nuclease